MYTVCTYREIVLFKSLKNCKRRNKRNFMFKFNSNKIMLCGGGEQYYFVQFQRKIFIFKISLHFSQ